jgi:hypothetical protein
MTSKQKSLFLLFSTIYFARTSEKNLFRRKLTLAPFSISQAHKTRSLSQGCDTILFFFTIFFDTVLPLARIARNKPQA